MAGSLLRVLRSIARHDRRALKEEAERNPDGLARWAHATESWMHGEIAAARRSAEIDLQTRPDDFDLIRICLDYHIRARDSAQIYAYANRLLAAKNPAAVLRRIYAAESIVLWPLWLMGYKGAGASRRARTIVTGGLRGHVTMWRNILRSSPRVKAQAPFPWGTYRLP